MCAFQAASVNRALRLKNKKKPWVTSLLTSILGSDLSQETSIKGWHCLDIKQFFLQTTYCLGGAFFDTGFPCLPRHAKREREKKSHFVKLIPFYRRGHKTLPTELRVTSMYLFHQNQHWYIAQTNVKLWQIHRIPTVQKCWVLHWKNHIFKPNKIKDNYNLSWYWQTAEVGFLGYKQTTIREGRGFRSHGPTQFKIFSYVTD